MAPTVEGEAGRSGFPWRAVGWGIAALLLLLPLAAMQLTSAVHWDGEDFLVAAMLIGGVGLIFELAVRSTRNRNYRGAVALTLAAAVLIIWANGAVGMIEDEDNPYNLLFGGVIAIALLGAAAVRLRAAGMARVTIVAAFAQVAVAAGGLGVDPHGALLSMVLAAPWLLAAALFGKAARDPSSAQL